MSMMISGKQEMRSKPRSGDSPLYARLSGKAITTAATSNVRPTRAEMVKRAEELAEKIRASGQEDTVAGLEGIDTAIFLKGQDFERAKWDYERQQRLRERPRKRYWKDKARKGTAERKVARLETREQEAYSRMVQAAEDVRTLLDMRTRVEVKAKKKNDGEEAQGEAQVSPG